MMRIFFTGAFRKPREMNWTIGVLLFLLAMAEGFFGYSLPGDLLSGAGLRIAYSVAESIPVVGTWLALGFFGGPFPNPQITQRLYISHVWIVPLLIAGAIALHLGMVWRQHHTQFAGPRRTEQNVVGSHLWPQYTIKSIALMSATFGVVALLGGFVTINPIWIYGPYDGWTVASPAQPDWYVAWLDGALRLGPALAIHLFRHTIPPAFWSGIVLPLILFGLLFGWPEIERSITGGQREHNLDDMPYERPWRLGLGVAVITFGTVLGFAGSDDIQAMILHVDVETLMIVYRWMLVIAPFVFGAVAVAIGFELRARLTSSAGRRQVRRATLRRNADGGFDEEPNSPSRRSAAGLGWAVLSAALLLLGLSAASADDAALPLQPSHPGLGAGTLYESGVPPVSGPSAPPLSAQALQNDGATLYATHCATCHGSDLRGTPGVPSMLDAGGAATDFYLTTGRMPLAVRSAVASSGEPAGPIVAAGTQAFHGAPHFDAREIAALDAYVRAHAAQSIAIPVVRVDPALLQRGRLLFEANCQACHGAAGQGATAGYQWTALPLDRATPTQIGEAIRVGPGVMPRFPTTLLSDDDISALATYVGELTHEPHAYGGIVLGDMGPVAEGAIGAFVGVGMLFWVVYFTGTKANGRRLNERDDP